jgi:hypothetical protein
MLEPDNSSPKDNISENLQSYCEFVRDEEVLKESFPELREEQLASLSSEELTSYEQQVDEYIQRLSERTATFIESLKA